MDTENKELISAIENLPCRLCLCWKAKLLKQHPSEDHFREALEQSLCG
jgi:hypothetical protein